MLTTGSLSSEQHLLIEYLLANVQTQVPFPLITTNFIFTDKNECRGNPKKLQESLNKEFCERKQNKVLNRNGDEHKNNMDAIKLPNQMTMPNNSPTLNISQELSSKERKSNLIEELQVKEPSYNLDWSNADSLCITIQLPGVKSGDECEVDIIQDVLMVKAAGKYDLFLPLDIHIDESNAEAQFFKEKSVLSIKVPYHKAA
ncbi:PIH1 domain-containing protein 2-like [Argonauta hians]